MPSAGGELPRTPLRMQSIAGAREQDNRKMAARPYAGNSMQDIENDKCRAEASPGKH